MGFTLTPRFPPHQAVPDEKALYWEHRLPTDGWPHLDAREEAGFEAWSDEVARFVRGRTTTDEARIVTTIGARLVDEAADAAAVLPPAVKGTIEGFPNALARKLYPHSDYASELYAELFAYSKDDLPRIRRSSTRSFSASSAWPSAGGCAT